MSSREQDFPSLESAIVAIKKKDLFEQSLVRD